jgi:HAD superfamily hydrolase (TIGR01509 family)
MDHRPECAFLCLERALASGMPTDRPAALLFDLDGTLVDTVGTRIDAWLAAFEEVGLPADRAMIAPLIGSDGKRLAREVAKRAGRELDEHEAEALDRRSGELFDERNRDPRPLPGAHACLTAADDAGIPWAIATSSRREQTTRSVAALQLDREPTIVDGSHVAHAKPAPDLFLLAARTLGVEPAACWSVGDATWDMRACVAAGMTGIAVLAGSAASADELRDAGATEVLRTLGELTARFR